MPLHDIPHLVQLRDFHGHRFFCLPVGKQRGEERTEQERGKGRLTCVFETSEPGVGKRVQPHPGDKRFRTLLVEGSTKRHIHLKWFQFQTVGEKTGRRSISILKKNDMDTASRHQIAKADGEGQAIRFNGNVHSPSGFQTFKYGVYGRTATHAEYSPVSEGIGTKRRKNRLEYLRPHFFR